MKQLERGDPPQQKAIEAERINSLVAQRNELEQRLRNLETIVCNVDFELNAKLNRLATQSLAALSSGPSAGRPAIAAAVDEAGSLATGTIRSGTRVAGRFVIERLIGAG